MKKHILFLVALFISTVMPAVADQLTPEQSVARLMAGQSGPHRVKGVQADRLQLTYTSASVQGNRYYVFNQEDNGGFVILGADDLAPSLLAYTTQGRFDEQHMSPGLRYWLSEYDRAISEAIATGKVVPTASRHKVRAAIQPILTTTWGQGDNSLGADQHYNIYCPKVNSAYTPVGCMATAMAQVMNRHQYPTRGKGSKTYTTTTLKRTLTANFGSTTYKWAEMQDHYGYTVGSDGRYTNEPFTQSSNEAVSTLMYHCGVAADMDYNIGGSGAYDENAAKAMLQYFDYDQGAYLADKIFYSSDEWEDLLHAELAAGRPVLYTGVTTQNEGHAFVCDGYDGQRFHINWGWNGLSDGYYTVLGSDALHPKEQGTGGSYTSGAFSQGNTAFIGMRPAQTGSKPHHQVAVGGTYSVKDYYSGEAKLTNSSPITLSCEDYVYGFNLVNARMKFGVRFVNTSNQTTYYASESDVSDVQMYYGSKDVYIFSSDVPDGVYKAYPVFQVEGETEWQDMLVPHGVEAPTVAFGSAELPYADAQLLCSDIIWAADDASQERKLNVTVYDPGNASGYDFDGQVTVGLVDDEGQTVAIFTDAAQDFQMTDMRFQSGRSFKYSITLPDAVENGHYLVRFFGYQPGSEHWTPSRHLIVSSDGASLTDEYTSLDIWVKDNIVSPTQIVDFGEQWVQLCYGDTDLFLRADGATYDKSKLYLSTEPSNFRMQQAADGEGFSLQTEAGQYLTYHVMPESWAVGLSKTPVYWTIEQIDGPLINIRCVQGYLDVDTASEHSAVFTNKTSNATGWTIQGYLSGTLPDFPAKKDGVTSTESHQGYLVSSPCGWGTICYNKSVSSNYLSLCGVSYNTYGSNYKPAYADPADPADANNIWQFIKDDKGENLYVYNVGANRFLSAEVNDEAEDKVKYNLSTKPAAIFLLGRDEGRYNIILSSKFTGNLSPYFLCLRPDRRIAGGYWYYYSENAIFEILPSENFDSLPMPALSATTTSKSLTLTEGDSQEIQVVVTPSDCVVGYFSSDGTVVSVTQQGQLQALKAGKATITFGAIRPGTAPKSSTDFLGVTSTITITVNASTPVGIHTIDSTTIAPQQYDLQGRRSEGHTNGVVVQRARKVLTRQR